MPLPDLPNVCQRERKEGYTTPGQRSMFHIPGAWIICDSERLSASPSRPTEEKGCRTRAAAPKGPETRPEQSGAPALPPYRKA